MKYKIMSEITKQCECCPLRERCIETDCVLYRIERILIKNYKKIGVINYIKHRCFKRNRG